APPGHTDCRVRWMRQNKENPLEPAYPRPQLRRAPWTPLNGPWRFRYDDERRYGTPSQIDGWPMEIRVPFPPESAASGVGDTGFHPACWYEREFDCAPGRD